MIDNNKTYSRWIWALFLLTILLVLTGIICVSFGSVIFGLPEMLSLLIKKISSTQALSDEVRAKAIILFQLRIPRLIMAALVGMSLAAAGTCFQALLRNPLADPYLLGISSGAALGAVSGIIFGLAAYVPLAFLGAVVTTFFVFALSRAPGGKIQSYTLILTGVVINTFFSSIITLLIIFFPPQQSQGIIFWLLGNIGTVKYSSLTMMSVFIIFGLGILFFKARDLDLLAQGDETAQQLGVDVERTKTIIILSASLLTAIAVAYNGMIGFVGLIVPHLARLIFGNDNRLLLPASVLLGAITVMIADTLARTIISPTELPIGAVTALVGGPFFLYLLRKAKQIFI